MFLIMCEEQTEQAYLREKMKDFTKLKVYMKFRKLVLDLCI